MHWGKWMAVTGAAIMAGCTSSAGYFVRDIRVVRPGVLLVEQCLVEHTDFGDSSSLSTGECRTKEIHLRPGRTALKEDRLAP